MFLFDRETTPNKTGRVIGVPLSESIDTKSYEGVPYVLYHLISIIEERFMNIDGIYRRIPSSLDSAPLLLKTMNEGIYPKDVPVHVATSTIKKYLIQLPDPVITINVA